MRVFTTNFIYRRYRILLNIFGLIINNKMIARNTCADISNMTKVILLILLQHRCYIIFVLIFGVEHDQQILHVHTISLATLLQFIQLQQLSNDSSSTTRQRVGSTGEEKAPVRNLLTGTNIKV